MKNICLLIIFSLFSCIQPSILLSETEINLFVSDSKTITATVTQNKEEYTITWSSEDESIATVSNGTVTAKKAGTTKIIASYGTLTAECIVTVNYRHGYKELSKEHQAVYNYILDKIYKFEANKDVYNDIYHRVYLDKINIDKDILYKICRYIDKDVPEAYLLGSYIPRLDNEKNQYYMRINQFLTPETYKQEMAQINAEVDKIIAKITPTMSDYDKVKLIHDELINLTAYGDVSGGNAGNLKGAFINKRIVCEGFSRATLYMCQKIQIQCVYIIGSLKTQSDPETWGSHAWNTISIDGKWYMQDVTGDGGFPDTIWYSEFLRGKTHFDKGHKYSLPNGEDPNGYSVPTIEINDYPTDDRN